MDAFLNNLFHLVYPLLVCLHIHTVHIEIISLFVYENDAQLNCLKNCFKIYIKIWH